MLSTPYMCCGCDSGCGCGLWLWPLAVAAAVAVAVALAVWLGLGLELELWLWLCGCAGHPTVNRPALADWADWGEGEPIKLIEFEPTEPMGRWSFSMSPMLFVADCT